MAPTEILARQHFETLAGPLTGHGVGVVLLTGRDKGAARAEKLRPLASRRGGGRRRHPRPVPGRRGLPRSWPLAVIDEQHRFGVAERQRLQAKGEAVHLLAMSATPIPRTLELTLYGDLDVSRIDEKPPGRTPVATRAAPMTRVCARSWRRLRDAVAGGAQAFWICPLVSRIRGLSTWPPPRPAPRSCSRRSAPSVGLVHGKLPAAEKDAVMAEFADGRLSVLVATTVVEVGVNVPNATIMVIEQAERFGLAQLHQLRGRVGRGTPRELLRAALRPAARPRPPRSGSTSCGAPTTAS